MADAEVEGNTSSDSFCLMLHPDDHTDGPMVKQVMFQRDESGAGSIDEAAADLLGIHGERVRCFSVPGFETKLGFALHMYIDLQGVEHDLAHNTNATQLWLVAHLPEEPPHVSPSSISGPVLLSAENFRTEEYVNLTLEDWDKLKKVCRAVQPNAQFLPYEAIAEDAETPAEPDA